MEDNGRPVRLSSPVGLTLETSKAVSKAPRQVLSARLRPAMAVWLAGSSGGGRCIAETNVEGSRSG